MKNKFNLPGFTAQSTFANKTSRYSQILTMSSKTEGSIYPAEGGCKCDWYDWFYDPSCLARELACQDPPDPRDHDPFGTTLPDEVSWKGYPLTSDTASDLSSEVAALRSDLKRQLNRIERCTCGSEKFVYNNPPFSLTHIPREDYLPPGMPIPPSPYYMNSY